MGLAESHENIYKKKRYIMINNFLGGVMWGMGTVIGGLLIVIILGFVISKIDLVPIVGSWMRDVLTEAYKGPPPKTPTLE